MRRPFVESRAERPAYRFLHFVTHLAEADRKARLFQLIEETGFLRDQAAHFGGFQQGSQDLETHVLPTAVACAEADGIDGQKAWPRFLHLALIAANLRGMAAALANDTILEALVSNGQLELALNVTDQLTDAATRAEARGVILGSVPSVTEAEVLQRLEDDLAAVPMPEDEQSADAWLRTLCSLAQYAGPQLRGLWPGLIGRLTSFVDHARQAWGAVAASLLWAGQGTDETLHRALGAVDRRWLRETLPPLLASVPSGALEVLDYLDSECFGKDAELHSRARITSLGRQVSEGTVSDPEIWQRLAPERLFWTLDLVEAGRDLWPRLSPILFT